MYGEYTNDIPTLNGLLRAGEMDRMLALYADDSANFATSMIMDTAACRMQRVLDVLLVWQDKRRMAVNVGKTAALLVVHRHLTAASRPEDSVANLSEVLRSEYRQIVEHDPAGRRRRQSDTWDVGPGPTCPMLQLASEDLDRGLQNLSPLEADLHGASVVYALQLLKSP